MSGTIPCPRPQNAPTTGKAPPVIKLVLADDEHLVRGAIAALLGLEEDIEVVAEVGRGDQVVETVLEHGAAVAVLDIEMPGATGLEAAAELRKQAPECGVVILTSFGRPGYLRRALSSGARGFLAKDAPVEQLAGAIRKVHEGGRYIDTELAAAAMVGGESPSPTARPRSCAPPPTGPRSPASPRASTSARARSATTCPTPSARPAPTTACPPSAPPRTWAGSEGFLRRQGLMPLIFLCDHEYSLRVTISR